MVEAAVVGRRLTRGDPVEFWLGRLEKPTRKNYRWAFNRFTLWLASKEWGDVDPGRLLLRQAEAEDPYEILELAQEYANGLDRTRTSKLSVYTAIRSFFDHNRCPLPKDPGFQIRSDKPGVVGKSGLEHLKRATQLILVGRLCFSHWGGYWQSYLLADKIMSA